MSTKWILDPTHSEITFKVKHLMISNVKGEFKNFSAEITSENETFINAAISANIDTTSIFTNNEDRDNHLKSGDFFDTEQFPNITFDAKSFDGESLIGNLTIKGITKEIKINIDFGGINQDPWGNTKAGFSIDTKINRSDYGLSWNAALETGGVLVSEEVKIAGELQFVKQG